MVEIFFIIAGLAIIGLLINRYYWDKSKSTDITCPNCGTLCTDSTVYCTPPIEIGEEEKEILDAMSEDIRQRRDFKVEDADLPPIYPTGNFDGKAIGRKIKGIDAATHQGKEE